MATLDFDKNIYPEDLTPWERLNMLLTDKVMRFNPYTVSDSVLLQCAERGYILPPPAFTQMAIFHFQDIRKVIGHHNYEAIFFSIGKTERIYHIPIGSLIHAYTHHHTLKPVHVKIGGKNLTNYKMVEKMQGRSFFVSHIIPPAVHNPSRYIGYRFHLLKGNQQMQADTIRQAMCQSKIEILEEIRSYPGSPYFIGTGSPPDFDTPLWNAIKNVRRFHVTPGHLPELSELLKMDPFR